MLFIDSGPYSELQTVVMVTKLRFFLLGKLRHNQEVSGTVVASPADRSADRTVSQSDRKQLLH